MTDDSTLDKLSNLIDDAFDRVFGRESSTNNTIDKVARTKELRKTPALYESIEDYTAQTGKRFRMTKDQKNLGMTREEAFKLTFGDN